MKNKRLKDNHKIKKYMSVKLTYHTFLKLQDAPNVKTAAGVMA